MLLIFIVFSLICFLLAHLVQYLNNKYINDDIDDDDQEPIE
jgi:hypothetical protein